MKAVSNICIALAVSVLLLSPSVTFARDIESTGAEIEVNVTAGEPTQIQFPGKILGGYKKKLSALSIERKDDSLIVFSSDNLSHSGEAILVRLDDGRSYSLRVNKSSADRPRDAMLTIKDERGAITAGTDDEEPAFRDKVFDYAPPSQVAGLMREMVLAAEFSKASIPGYKVSDQHKGETVLDDGTVQATIDRIFIGPNLWGYVLDAQNKLDQTQQINPASFRLDGTRAISMRNWELSPRALNVEQQLASKDKTKIYIITKARKVK